MKERVFLISKSDWKAEAEATLNMFRWGVVLDVREHYPNNSWLEITMGVDPLHEEDLEDYIAPYV